MTMSSEQLKGQKIINQTIEAHGGKRYDNCNYSFAFRGKEYQFKNSGDSYTYTLTTEKTDTTILDVLTNDGFTRSINGKETALSDKNEGRYSRSLNSVIYFSTLPHKLSDGAVKKKLLSETKIKDSDYYVIEVSFKEEGGGVDHEDIFYYWINQNDKHIDFLAYSYSVNNGGVRFRTAENRRNVGGIIFQDYINYKAPLGTKLSELPNLWMSGKLKKLSEIKTEKVRQIK